MKWEEFKTLEINKQIEIFNNLIKEHGSITKASKQLGISDKTVRTHLNSLGYRFIDGAYVRNTNMPVKNETSLKEPVSEDNRIINMLKIEQLVDRMLDEKLEKLTKNKKSDKIKLSSRCDGSVRYRSFGVYEPIADEFVEFCKNHYYSQIELLSQAMIEFMEKYK